jgi:septal ring factor EnvC (AmiA/AmiB activator)
MTINFTPKPIPIILNLSGSEPYPVKTEMTSQDQEFEQALSQVERSLVGIKQRYAQVKRDQRRQAELKNRIDQVIPELRQTRSRQLREELRQIEAELETIELNLESSLFTWGSLKEPFWQAVRFGGLGIILGWILKSLAG